LTTTAQSLIKEVQTLLQDTTGTRWPATDIAVDLNDGQREIAALRPEMFVTKSTLTTVAGAHQTLPTACVNFMGMPRVTNGGAMTKVDRNLLDALDPSWYTGTTTAALRHYCYDPATPNLVDVNPPATAGTSVDIVYSTLPADIATPSGALWSTATGNISVDDVFKNALTHFCMFRALARDAESASGELSALHYQLFKAGVTGDVAPSAGVAPK